MKKCIISYSKSGNNHTLAESIAKTINFDHIIISEKKNRKVGKIIFDIIFNRIPKVEPAPEILNEYDEIILMGPIWMEKAATPLRSFFRYIKEHNLKYSFITISGGALHKNPKLIDDLKLRAGENIVKLKDLYITDLIQMESPNMKDTSNYSLSQEDIMQLTNYTVESLNLS